MRNRRGWGVLPVALLAGVVAACGGGGSGGGPWEPRIGADRFVSADPRAGDSWGAGPDRGMDENVGAGGAEEAPGDGDDRTVEEGDVYRIFADGLLLNLNAWRGLQVIDLRDLEHPQILARLEMSGTPVELYVSGTTAYVLMNDWRGYWGSRNDVEVDTFEGGVVFSVDLAEPRAPRVIERQRVPGWIHRSRLVRGGGQEALYVVAQEYDWSRDDGIRTRVQSFALSSGRLVPVSELDLGGWIADIAATPEALLVARTQGESGTSRVAVVDISAPDGTMVAGDEVEVAGRIANQFNMDLRGGVLRIVSGATRNGTFTNHLQTFDATDLRRIVPIDHETFGRGENLYATLFLDEAAFFVTYRQVDPFHAFAITPEGDATEMSQFVVSGWNDFFRAVLGQTRLIGIGTNDEDGRTMAVSLYDITDLANPDPLVARAEVEASWSWSDASWDHRAFSVLENAVQVQGPGGEVETGLVLLPYSGWEGTSGRYTAAVQIFTFSANSLTRRGSMVQGSPVHRSFQPVAEVAANLSQEDLRLFDISDPDAPAALGRVELAPNYSAVIPFGSHVLRVKQPGIWWGYFDADARARPAVVQVVPADTTIDTATPVATFEVPQQASLHKVGDSLLVAVSEVRNDATSRWSTAVEVFDLSDPLQPRSRGMLVTDLFPARSWSWYYGYGYLDARGFAGCGVSGPGYVLGAEPLAVGEALVFAVRVPERRSLGIAQTCSVEPVNDFTCWQRGMSGCVFYSGRQECTTRGGVTACSGTIERCTWSEDVGDLVCEPVDRGSIATTESCYEYEAWRYWDRYEIHVVDLRDPDAPRIASSWSAPTEEEAGGLVVDGTGLWVNHLVPVEVAGDSRPWVRYFSRRIALADPARPRVGPAVNLPGELFAVEGSALYTVDRFWRARQAQSAVARLRLEGDRAILEGYRPFSDAIVQTVATDGAGQVLVSHWNLRSQRAASAMPIQLTLLDARAAGLEPLATVPVDSWATLQDVRAGRALFQVPGGLLVFNLENPAAPWPQAFFSTKGWPSRFVVEGREILFAAGPYGIYQLDLGATNLPQPGE